MSKKTRRLMRQLFEQAAASNFEVGELSQIWRAKCTDCGSANLHWTESSEIVALVPPESRLDVQQGISNGFDGKGWVCKACGCFGLFKRFFDS